MPATLTYPGVYIEEIPSGVRTITGVATSITAFLGRALRGPVNQAVTLNNYGDFESNYGGLDPAYPLGYAVRDFFQNGGAQAIVVRLYKADGGPSLVTLKMTGSLNLNAASEGTWGNSLRGRVDYNKLTDEIAQRYNPTYTKSDLFNLSIYDGITGKVETFLNLTVKDSPRRVDRVLAANSSLARVTGSLPLTVPTNQPDPETGKTIWTSDTASIKVQDADKATDGAALTVATDFTGSLSTKTGLYALENVDLFNLLCIPPDTRSGDTPADALSESLAYCQKRRAMLIVDAPGGWTSANDIVSSSKLGDLNLTGLAARNAALYFPRVLETDPKRDGQIDTFVPCGIIAGIMSATDAQRGVWKAPAGLDAGLTGVQGLAVNLTDDENGMLNPLGINCLRTFPAAGRVVWGARTLRGDDQLADEYKYIPVRRLALYIEESLYRGTKWAVFEPNDEPLWAQLRLNVGSFMHNLFRQGAFQGQSPRDAYFVKCDKESTTQNDINLGIVNIIVGFAPLKPAEFVVIQLQQMAGQIDV
jgi:uncharacterized protein